MNKKSYLESVPVCILLLDVGIFTLLVMRAVHIMTCYCRSWSAFWFISIVVVFFCCFLMICRKVCANDLLVILNYMFTYSLLTAYSKVDITSRSQEDGLTNHE